MSAPAGRFQDHYAVLGVDPKAESEIIQKAYSRLAQKYNPKTGETADPEKFEAVNLAFEVLSDPLLRREFDRIKGVGEELSTPRFSGDDFFDAIVRERELRMAILSLLYDRRRTKPLTPSLSMRHLENMIQASADEIIFTLWYLKQRNLASNDDKSSLQITVDGMDFLENNRPTPEIVMSFIKPAAMPIPKTDPNAAGQTLGAEVHHARAEHTPAHHASTQHAPAQPAPSVPTQAAEHVDASPAALQHSADSQKANMLKINFALTGSKRAN